MLQRQMIFTAAFALIIAASGAHAADAQAGKAKAEKTCAECHDAADWKGTDEAELQGKIKDVVSGKTKHEKKLKLSEADIADIAAFWASGAQ